MDQFFSQWLDEHRTEVEHRWKALAQREAIIPETLQEAEGTFDFDLLRLQLLDALSTADLPDLDWLEDLAPGLKQHNLLALLNSLRQVLFGLFVQQGEPEQIAERWRVLGQRIDRLGLALAEAFDGRLVGLDAEREHWHTLYNLTRELSSSIDLGYVLRTAITRILSVLDATRGAVLLLDSQTDLVVPRATHDWPDMRLNFADLPSDWQRGYGGPKTLQADDIDEGIFREFVQVENETVVAAPLLANGRFHGILAVATSDIDGFDSHQRSLLEAVVGNLASSLGGSEVIQTLNTQARELGLMLRQQQEEGSKREAILASIADGVVFNDQNGRVVLVNRAAELILAMRAEDLIGRDLEELLDLFTAGARGDILEAMRTVLADPEIGVPSEVAQTVLHIDSFVVNAQFSPVITAQGEFLGIVTVFRDITKEVQADRAKSEFVSTVSHELRTPMTAIKGFTDLLHSGTVGEVNEDQKRFLGIVRSNADRLTALISDLLDISRVETGRVRFEPQPIQLGDIAKSVVDALAPNADRKGHTLTLHVEAGLPEIMGDPDRLNQVFTNLVGNAINYTPEGGKVNVNIYSVGEAIRVDVQDDGIGIRTEDLSKVFERFYRADHPVVHESRGTGLGLPIVRMFVEMHGGRVWAESDVGKGSTFTVLLPLPTAQLGDIMDVIATKAPVPFEKRQVLVADDDPDIAELVKLHLEEAGYGVTAVGRGVKVLEVARRHCPDVIVLDILLPDMDGRAVLEALKSEPVTADIPVVMLTVVADDGTAFDLGAAGYLIKPIDIEEMLQEVQAAIARRGRVLVVEDDLDTIEMVRLALRRVGYNVDVAADGYEAMSLARRWRPQAILLDLRLPGMDGYETLTHLKRSLDTKEIPIVVMSAHVADMEKEARRLKGMGVVSFLPKPFTINRLVAEIDKVINMIWRPGREK